MQHPEKVLGESLIAHDKSSKVLEPGKKALDLPPPLVASERATVLGPVCAGPPMRCNQLHAAPGKFCIQAVRLVGVITDETHRERLDKPLREGCVDQGDFVRRGTLDVNRDPGVRGDRRSP